VSAAVFALLSAVTIAGQYKLHSRTAPVPELTIASTPEQVSRGQAIATSFCASCHSKTGALTGGWDIGEDFPAPVGSFVSSNLTPTGPLRHWSDGEVFRAIRNSIDADGHWLYVMSLTNAGRLSDDDIKSLIAYLRSLPAAGQATADPPDRLNPLGVVMLGAGLLPKGGEVFTGVITSPSKGPTAQYGEYIASYQDCRQCHGNDLSGGVPGQLAPLGPDLHLVREWKREEFIKAMRTGINPGGHELDSKVMPWRDIGKMDDDELTALFEYMTRLPGAQQGASN
jgi:cytochrome c553